MIKLVLFDIGGVLCADNRDEFLKPFCEYTGLSLKQLHKRLFPGTWHMHDKGLLTKKQAWARILPHVPKGRELSPTITEAGNQFFPRKDMIEFVKQLKKKVAVGDFSNMSSQLHSSLIKKKFPYRLFDPRFLSYQMRMRKPELQSYRFVMKKTGLKPQEILFIDDKKRNLLPARKLGWKTIHFTDLKQLKKQIKRFL